jgi:TM2 domain-containing membrane protein YozV
MKQILLTILFLSITTSAFASFPVKRNIKKTTTEVSIDSSVNTTTTSTAVAVASQGVALILCAFLGPLGVHRFYLGDIWQGIVQLLTFGAFGIWSLIDFIRLILGGLGPGW